MKNALAEEKIAEERYSKTSKAIFSEVIVPDYRNFYDQADHLVSSTDQYCLQQKADDPNLNLKFVEKDFKKVFLAFQRIQSYRFGAAYQENRRDRLQFWPDKKNLTSRHLSTLIQKLDGAVAHANKIKKMSIAVQGISAFERLVYGRQKGNFCLIAPAISQNIALIADEIHHRWINATSINEEAASHHKTRSNRNIEAYSNKEVVQAIHTSLSALLEFVDRTKLSDVIRKDRESVRIKLSEAWRSGLSIAAIRVDLQTALRLYRAGDVDGLQSYVLAQEEGGENVNRHIEKSLERAISLLGEDDSYEDILARDHGYQNLKLIRDHLSVARDAVDTDLRGILQLGISFNASDGD